MENEDWEGEERRNNRGCPGKLPVRKAPYTPLTLMEHLQRAYEGLWNEPKTEFDRTMSVRG